MALPYRIEKLRRDHHRATFASGDSAMDRWMHQYAYQNMKSGVSVVYVLVEAAHPLQVMGFYTLSAATVELANLPPEWMKFYPKYPEVPVALLGRLGMAIGVEGHGLGSALVADALQRAWHLRNAIGLAGVLVQAKDIALVPFYERLGFQRLGESLDLFIPMRKVDAAIVTPAVDSDATR